MLFRSAPQLAALGPDFGGVLRGAGTLSGTMDTPSLTASLDGQNLRMKAQNLKSLHATANLGSGRGAADPLTLDLQIADYAGGAPGSETQSDFALFRVIDNGKKFAAGRRE